jgi:fluoride exporter
VKILWVGLGGFLGTVLRYWLGTLMLEKWGHPFPLGTLLVNVAGCFLIGLIAGLKTSEAQLLFNLPSREFIIIGFLGGFTTFSAFSFQTLQLLQQSQWVHAGGNILGSVFLCLFAVWIGDLVAKWL